MPGNPIQNDPAKGDFVCFLFDKTICKVLGLFSNDPRIYGLEHPSRGQLLMRREGFLFPITAAALDAPTPSLPKVLCVNCRWHKRIPHPGVGPGAPFVSSCWNSTIMMAGERDYVTGEPVPGDPYVLNREGLCHGYELPAAAQATRPDPTNPTNPANPANPNGD